MSLFEKMTDQGRQVIGLAQQEARDLNHSSLGTEHLLLGLLAEGHGAAAESLTSLGVSLDVTRDAVAALIGRGKPPAPEGHLPLTSQSRKVLELAVREALQLGHMHVGTGHLLLGITRIGDGAAVRILVAHGTDMRLVRERVIQRLQDYPDGEGRYQPGTEAGTPSWHEVLPVLDAIQARLTAIEQRLGITPAEPDGT